MSDNFNNIMDNIIRFIAGERPSADKFNALVAYFSQNTQELNDAIGDIRGENSPFGTTNRLTIPWGRQITSDDIVAGADPLGRYLDIANIGRLIGPSSNLNNRYLSSGSFKIQNEAVTSFTTEYKTNYPVFNEDSVQVTKGGVLLERIGTSETFNSDSQYKYYNGSFIFSSPTNEETVVEYTTNPSNYGSGANYQGSRFNVIPDPNDRESRLTFEAFGGGYIINLPEIGAAQSSLSNEIGSTLNNDHVNHTQEDGETRQKYLLPKVLTDLNPVQDVEEAKVSNNIPKYFLYLKCEEPDEVFLDADYYYMNESKIYVENIDLGNCNLDTDTFRIVTVGTDITTSIDDLRVKFVKHNHDGSFGDAAIDVKALTGLFDSQTGNIYTKSVSSKNPLSSYLHRDGFDLRNQEDINANNMMRGHLVIGNTGDQSQKPNSVAGTTYKLAFGRPANDNNVDLLSGDTFVGGVAALGLDGNEDLITRSATSRSLINVFQNNYRVDGYLENSLSNRLELKANQTFAEDESKFIVTGQSGDSLSIRRIIDFSKNINSEYTEETSTILDVSDYKVSATRHHSVLSDVFELGPKKLLRHDDHTNNGDVTENTLRSFKTRVEKGNLYDSGKENIISGGLIEPENTLVPPNRTFLNLNADLFRRERASYSIGYDKQALNTVSVYNNSGNEIPGYVVHHTNCDITIGNWSNLTNRNNTTGIFDAAINIYLDFKYEKTKDYLRNDYAGTEFNINLIFGEDVNEGTNINNTRYFINIISLGDSMYCINGAGVEVKNPDLRNDPNGGYVRDIISNESYWDSNNNRWEVNGTEFDAESTDHTKGKYISLTGIGNGSVPLPGGSIKQGSVINIKGTLFSNPVLNAFNSSTVTNDPEHTIPLKVNQGLTYKVDVSGLLIWG